MTERDAGNGSVLFSGYLPDLVRLGGVEETHHSVFYQLSSRSVASYDQATMTTEVYDAQESEFRALRWQLRYAQYKKMPRRTIDVLRNRIVAARKVRSNGSLQPDLVGSLPTS